MKGETEPWQNDREGCDADEFSGKTIWFVQ